MKTTEFRITGMTCAACQAHVTKAAAGLETARDVEVNLLTERMKITYDENVITEADVIKSVTDIGYGAALYSESSSESGVRERWQEHKNAEKQKEKQMLNRLRSSGVFLVLLMYVAMGNMLSLPLPDVLSGAENALVNALVQFMLSSPVLVINKHFFVSGIRGLFKKTANMDTLVALGSGASFVYGVVVLFIMAYHAPRGNAELVSHYAHQLYFESSAMILTLVTVGKYLETRSKGKTSDALGKLVELTPKTATVIRNGKEVLVEAGSIREGETLLIRPGERIAVDGYVLEGESFVDQSSVTGESMPVEKKKGDKVISATLNKNGSFTMCASKVGEDTTISQIIRLVENASATKPPIARLADKVSGIFVPVVLVIALATFVAWLIATADMKTAISFGVTVLVISCPCALGLATPVAVMAGAGKAAENGILIKSASALEIMSKVDVVVFDKTGTITSGEMSVNDICILNKLFSEREFLSVCAALEKGSEHPLGAAVRKRAEEDGCAVPEPESFEAYKGKGVKGIINGKNCISGNIRFMSENNIDCSAAADKLSEYSSAGKTPLLFACDGELLGIIAVADTVREDSKSAIGLIKELGKDTVMLTGDNTSVAEFTAQLVGVDSVVAELLPGDKEKYIRSLQEKGKKVAFVGDGINDAPALTRADVGIAIGAGTDIAVESADVVLVKSSLSDVVKAIELSKAVVRNIKMNLFWAFFYNVLGIPLAAGAFWYVAGLRLSPMIGSAAMSVSSLCVVTNALRLRFFKSRLIKNENKQKEDIFPKEEGGAVMTKVIKVEGMMCPRCEAHVQKALLAVDGVAEAIANHETDSVSITLTKEVEDSVLVKAITDEGYTAQV